MENNHIKTAIKVSGKTQEQAANIVGISREHFGRLLKEGMPEAYIIKLKDAGIDIPDVIKSDANLELLKLEIKHLKEIIAMLEQENTFLKSMLNPKVSLKSGR